MTTALGDLMNLFRNQYSNLPLLVKAEDCAGKTYVVVGANIGLGYETAKHLVELGSKRVILAVRSMSRGEAALQTIESETGIHGVAAVWQLDLASYDSMIAFADRAAKELERLDALVMNAAAANKDWILCEGWESTMMVNVLGTLFLAILMMPQLEASAKKFSSKSRIVMVTSGLGYTMQQELSKIDKSNVLRDINDAKRWPLAGANRYSLSKLLQIFAIRQLAHLAPVSRTGVTINIVSPGLCKTGLLRYSDSGTKMQFFILQTLLGRSAEWGSRNLLHGIAAGDESHGKYMTYCEIREDLVPVWVSNEDGQQWGQRIWKEAAAEFEKMRPGCVSKASDGLCVVQDTFS